MRVRLFFEYLEECFGSFRQPSLALGFFLFVTHRLFDLYPGRYGDIAQSMYFGVMTGWFCLAALHFGLGYVERVEEQKQERLNRRDF